MTPKEALDRVREAPEDAQAWAVIRGELDRLAARLDEDGQLRADAIEAVREKLEDKAMAGDLDPIASPAAYLRTALRNWVISRKRHLAATGRAADRARRAEEEARLRRAPPIDGELLALLGRVYEKAVSRRDPWQRDHLQRAWRQMVALQTERATLRELVIRGDGLDAADEEAVRLAVQRAHTAHRRAREALADALEALVRAGEMDAEAADLVGRTLSRLKRRQDRAGSRVTEGDGP